MSEMRACITSLIICPSALIKLYETLGCDIFFSITSIYTQLLSTDEIIDISPYIIDGIDSSDLPALRILVHTLLSHNDNEQFRIPLDVTFNYRHHWGEMYILNKSINLANLHEQIKDSQRRYKYLT